MAYLLLALPLAIPLVTLVICAGPCFQSAAKMTRVTSGMASGRARSR